MDTIFYSVLIQPSHIPPSPKGNLLPRVLSYSAPEARERTLGTRLSQGTIHERENARNDLYREEQ